jgi:hypothetical protein
MRDPEPCELHEAAVLVGTHDSEDLLRLARSPIGDECQMCPVCRLAREYIEHRVAERAGLTFPADESGEAILRKLQVAVDTVKHTVRRAT